jgi:uncharacterized protein
MSLKAIWADRNPHSKFLILVGVVLISYGTILTIGMFLIKPLFGIDLLLDKNFTKRLDDPIVLEAIKFLQLLQSFAVFIIPAFITAYLFSPSASFFLGIDKKPLGSSVVLAMFATIAAVPFINWLGAVNHLADLPAWMKETEEQAMELTKAYLRMEDPGDMIYSLLLMALLPAIGEELLFRGVVQRLFTDWVKNIHLAVIITGIVFSAIHMQFYGFLPRMALGIFLGYLFVWTGSLWVPVIVHFTNNGAAVIFEYFNQRGMMPVNPDTVGTTNEDIPAVAVSFVLLTLSGYLISRTERKKALSGL